MRACMRARLTSAAQLGSRPACVRRTLLARALRATGALQPGSCAETHQVTYDRQRGMPTVTSNAHGTPAVLARITNGGARLGDAARGGHHRRLPQVDRVVGLALRPRERVRPSPRTSANRHVLILQRSERERADHSRAGCPGCRSRWEPSVQGARGGAACPWLGAIVSPARGQRGVSLQGVQKCVSALKRHRQADATLQPR